MVVLADRVELEPSSSLLLDRKGFGTRNELRSVSRK